MGLSVSDFIARLNREGLETYRRLVEEQLMSATKAAERWARGGPRPAANKAWNAARQGKVSA